MGKLGLRTCVRLLRRSGDEIESVDFPVQPVEDAGWEGRHDNIAIGALEDDAHGKPSGLTRRW
jgi:hypothetical protein